MLIGHILWRRLLSFSSSSYDCVTCWFIQNNIPHCFSWLNNLPNLKSTNGGKTWQNFIVCLFFNADYIIQRFINVRDNILIMHFILWETQNVNDLTNELVLLTFKLWLYFEEGNADPFGNFFFSFWWEYIGMKVDLPLRILILKKYL